MLANIYRAEGLVNARQYILRLRRIIVKYYGCGRKEGGRVTRPQTPGPTDFTLRLPANSHFLDSWAPMGCLHFHSLLNCYPIV